MPKDKAVSLHYEVIELTDALEGAHRLLASLAEVPWPDRDGREVLAASTSMVGFLLARLQILKQVLHGDEDPARLLTPQNTVSRGTGADHADEVLLAPWSDARKVDQAKSLMEQLQRRRKRIQEARR